MATSPSSTNPAAPGAEPAPRRRRWLARLAVFGAWAYLAAAVAAWAVVRAADLWPPATALAFGPLWLLLVPGALLVVAAALFHRRSLWVLAPALALAAGPVSGFCVPVEQLAADPPGSPRLRVLTCNMHYAKADPGPLDRLIKEEAPDVVLLQESRDGARYESLSGRGWHVHKEPGLFIAGRHPIRRAERLGAHPAGERGSVMRYELEAPGGVVTVFNLHFASPRDGLAAVLRRNPRGLDEVAINSATRWRQSRHLAGEAARAPGPVLLVGDFNTPPQSAILREALAGYRDAFDGAGWGWGFTFFARRPTGVRIDHVLVGGGGHATRCRVGPNVGSPHRPVIADVAW